MHENSIHAPVVAAACLLIAGSAFAQSTSSAWQKGYVFAATGNSSYKVYTNTGRFVETITSGLRSANTAGGAFDSKFNLWTTEFQGGRVVAYQAAHPHKVLRTIASGSTPESLVFDATGNFYVGHADGDRAIRKYDTTGKLLATFRPQRDARGTDWIDLAADQRTMWYTSEGRKIKRFDVVANRQLPDFVSIPGSRFPFVACALRLLPPFDGSGGLIVADFANIKRLDGQGRVIKTYDATGQNRWFSMNLDPNGTSFWAGDITTRRFYRFNIASGKIEVGPIQTGPALGGLIVLGEITGGNAPPKFVAPTPCNTTTRAVVGSPVTFTVKATDPNASDLVTLTAIGTPPGATFTPSLPRTGNPVSSVFRWTPTNNQIGTHTILFTAKDRSGLVTRCSTKILVNACSNRATWSNYGAGWPGTNGVPALTLSAPPKACTTIQLRVGNSLGKATGACLVTAASKGAIKTIFGGTLLLDLMKPGIVVFTFALPARGVSWPMKIPCNVPRLCGLKLYMQGFVFDTGASQTVAFTKGLQMTIGN